MNPVDYFDASQDTIKRAIGERLLPPVSEWSNEQPDVYEYLYGGRLYRIMRLFVGTPTSNTFKLKVTPGATRDIAWVFHSGEERAHATQFEDASKAAASANQHALKYGPVT